MRAPCRRMNHVEPVSSFEAKVSQIQLRFLADFRDFCSCRHRADVIQISCSDPRSFRCRNVWQLR